MLSLPWQVNMWSLTLLELFLLQSIRKEWRRSVRERETDSHDPTQTKTKSVVVISNVDIVRTESWLYIVIESYTLRHMILTRQQLFHHTNTTHLYSFRQKSSSKFQWCENITNRTWNVRFQISLMIFNTPWSFLCVCDYGEETASRIRRELL
jgi:hypothetical protein